MSGAKDLRDFWRRLQTGVEVAVADTRTEVLLGVREGFRRYFDSAPGRPGPVVVIPQATTLTGAAPLLVDDSEVLAHLRSGLSELRREVGDTYHFLVASEGGTHAVEDGEERRVVVRCWSLLWSTAGEAVGSSGSVEIPRRLLESPRGQGVRHLPGTRRDGGLYASLTGGLASQRSAVAEATAHALASLFYGIVEGRPVRWR